jgi:hypothetical protein
MSDFDLMLVVGIVCLVLTAPSLLSAYVDGRVPRGAAIMVLIGGALVALALTRNPSGYRFEEIPHVFVRVIGQLVN